LFLTQVISISANDCLGDHTTSVSAVVADAALLCRSVRLGLHCCII